MSGLELVVIGVVALLGAIGAGVAAVARNRGRRNRVVPDVPTEAPDAWAGAHTPLARLHRRLRAAVEAARAVPDPAGALIQARVEVEHAALAVDEHLVALHRVSERERAGRMAQASAAVASVEEAAAKLADTFLARGHSDAMPAVEAALERARLVAEARAELDAGPAAILDDGSVDGRMPDVPGTAHDEEAGTDAGPTDVPRGEPDTG